MKKISFDFDNTFDNEHIQKYAVELMNKGYDVHIVTSRPPSGPDKWSIKGNPVIIWTNDDLYELAGMLGIKNENIHFTNYSPKYKFFEKNEDFIFHVDDDDSESFEISFYTKTKGIPFDSKWKDKCDNLLK